ncbi:hypothetical protein BFJ66_g11079 [Fusarium oxysporum f. sp. cepae]|uniref:Uncharacterized protein n=1 Tax=Fusarium oxysporum f. sp. cepae TaxID=396571 RepID=A0A3L6NZK6_FUSOX|nr:hypothetical protein BFJ65_g2941 [Fusarium oxysporum f. sp. cepae]RKK33183.1 hypothetical protein BFJ67_g14364 [Fusarium oxysporum f. sp. cepae]RKK41333.1 hypothetical protein BFJ66_g11079 [Fusarium oxysporum f. sp. cepae]
MRAVEFRIRGWKTRRGSPQEDPWWSSKQQMRSYSQLITSYNTTELRMCTEPCIIRVHYKTSENL